MARTRMWRTTALASLGERDSGGLWQRPQFTWNRFSPLLVELDAGRAGFDAPVFAACFESACPRAPQAKKHANKLNPAAAKIRWRFI